VAKEEPAPVVWATRAPGTGMKSKVEKNMEKLKKNGKIEKIEKN